MECNLRIIPSKQIVVSSYTGPIWTNNRIQNRDRTLSFCRENDIYKLIVDTRGQISHSTIMEIYEFSNDLASQAVGFHIAFVRDPESKDISFMDNVAANRGCRCKSFLNFKEAESWLISDTNSPKNPSS